MKLEVQLFASLRERVGADRLLLEDLPEPLDVVRLRPPRERLRVREHGGEVRIVADRVQVLVEALLVVAPEPFLEPLDVLRHGG